MFKLFKVFVSLHKKLYFRERLEFMASSTSFILYLLRAGEKSNMKLMSYHKLVLITSSHDDITSPAVSKLGSFCNFVRRKIWLSDRVYDFFNWAYNDTFYMCYQNLHRFLSFSSKTNWNVVREWSPCTG